MGSQKPVNTLFSGIITIFSRKADRNIDKFVYIASVSKYWFLRARSDGFNKSGSGSSGVGLGA